MVDESVVGAHFYHRIFFFISEKFYQIVNVDESKAEVHRGGRIRTDHQRVTGKYQTADSVDEAQLDDRSHQHRNKNKCGTDVAYRFDYNF